MMTVGTAIYSPPTIALLRQRLEFNHLIPALKSWCGNILDSVQADRVHNQGDVCLCQVQHTDRLRYPSTRIVAESPVQECVMRMRVS